MYVLCEVILGEVNLIATAESYDLLKLLMRKCAAEKLKRYGARKDGTPWIDCYYIEQVPLAPFLSEKEVERLEDEVYVNEPVACADVLLK